MKFKSFKYIMLGLVVTLGWNNCAEKGFEIIDPGAAELSSEESGSGTLPLPTPTPSGPPPFDDKFTCSGEAASSVSIRRLKKSEYVYTLERLLGGLTAEIKSITETLSEEDISETPDTFPHLVDISDVAKFEEVAFRIMISVKGNSTLLKNLKIECLQSNPTASCQEAVVKKLGLIAFRRPLDSYDVLRYKNALQIGKTAMESLGFLVYAFLLSPEFNYHLPIGSISETKVGNRLKLDQYQIASRISYLITDSPPDDALFLAAEKGELKTISQLESQVERIFSNPRAKEKMRKFFDFWLHYEVYTGDLYTNAFKAGVNISSMTADAMDEIDTFVDYIVWTQKGSLKDVLTSRVSFAKTNALSAIYGHAPVTSTTPATTSNDRVGILSRVPVLMSEGNETRPILRGVKIRTRVLCDVLGAPSGINLGDTDFFNDSARAQFSTRIRTHKLTNSTSCVGCHSLINDLGFVFENFDSLGRKRSIEKAYNADGAEIANHAVDTIVTNVPIGERNYNAVDSNQLVDILAENSKAPACLVKQLHRFYNVQTEKLVDGCVLKQMFEELTKNNGTQTGSIRNALKRAIANDAFLYRQVGN